MTLLAPLLGSLLAILLSALLPSGLCSPRALALALTLTLTLLLMLLQCLHALLLGECLQSCQLCLVCRVGGVDVWAIGQLSLSKR